MTYDNLFYLLMFAFAYYWTNKITSQAERIKTLEADNRRMLSTLSTFELRLQHLSIWTKAPE